MMSGSFVIRPADENDVSPLAGLALRSKAHWGYSAEFLQACRLELSVAPEEAKAGNVFVLEESGRLIGFYSLEAQSRRDVELGHLFVEPHEIGRGYGRALVEHAKSEARRRGYRTMIIQGDLHAEPFYVAAGAKLLGRRESASISGRDLPLLSISLVSDAAGSVDQSSTPGFRSGH